VDDTAVATALQHQIEAEVNSTIKLIMASMEQLASMAPHEAAAPGAFNATRNQVIRRVWNLSKECIRYGARSVQHQQSD
jgi:hypothetical protein